MIVEEVEAEQIVARLLDDIVEGQYLAKDALVSTILSDLLSRQTASNPIVLGGVDATLDQVRSVDIRWDSLLRACLAVRDLVGGALYLKSDKLNPPDIEVEISNRSRTLADTISDLYDRIERSDRYQAAPQEEPAIVYKGTHYHMSSTEEQTVFAIPLSQVAVVQGIFLDFVELTKAATVRIYQKIDGVAFQEIDSFFWDPSKRRGFATRHLTPDVDVRVTLQSQEAEGVTRNVPYRYYVK